MHIKMMDNIYLRMYSSIQWQNSTMKNHNYFCTNLINQINVAFSIWLLSFN